MIPGLYIYKISEEIETTFLGRRIYVTSIVYPARTLVPESDIDIIAAGAGLTKFEARLKAEMEFYERYAWLTAYKNLVNKDIIWIKGKEFDEDLVEYLKIYKKFDPEKEYPAIKYYNIFGDERLLPANLVICTDPWVEPLYLQTTNGWAAHFDFIDALYSGVMELVERDALNRWWHLMLEPNRVYEAKFENGTILALDLPSAIGYTVATIFLPDRYPGFLLFAGSDIKFKNAMIKALLESVLHLPSLDILEILTKRIATQEGIVEISDVVAYYANQPREKYISSILNLPREKIEIDFQKEHISKEEKIKVITKMTKEYDVWFREFTPPEIKGITIVSVWSKELVPFLNPHDIIEHPRLAGIKRRDVLPMA